MDMSSSRGQDLTDRPLPTAEGLAPRKLRWEVVVCDDAVPEPRAQRGLGQGTAAPGAVGRQHLGVGSWALRSQFHRPRGAWPTFSKGFYALFVLT